MQKKINIGIIGCGGISAVHFKGYQPLTDAEIVAVCDLDQMLAHAKRDEYCPDAEVYSDVDSLLARDDIDGVNVCTQTVAHAPLSIAAMEAGKHVLCEKPMAATLAEAEAMKATSERTGKALLLDHSILYSPLTATLMHHLPSIGEIFWVKTRNAHYGNVPEHIAKSGALFDIGYHPLYTAIHFNGPVVKVNGWRRCFLRTEMRDDNGLFVLEHESGISIVEASFSSHGKYGSTRPIEIFGSEGVLLSNRVPTEKITLTIGSEMNEVEILDGDPWNIALMKHFCDCIRGEAEPLSGPDAGLAVMKVFDAIEESDD
jgi:UDP-N-acetylglucosamine 3-dehydrogenase